MQVAADSAYVLGPERRWSVSPGPNAQRYWSSKMVAAADLTGIRFGKLVCLRRVPSLNGHARWLCQCDCGGTHESSATALKGGRGLHCGCVARGRHRLSRHPLQTVWSGMKQRCSNPRSDQYKNYGARGISVCPEWADDLKVFVEWAMSNGWKKGLEIDRIDVNGNYTPVNCRFVTSSQNKRNMRTTTMLTFQGKMVPLHDVAEIVGMSPRTLRSRLFTQKMSVEDATTLPRDVWATRKLRSLRSL